MPKKQTPLPQFTLSQPEGNATPASIVSFVRAVTLCPPLRRVRWVSWLGGVVDTAIQPAVRKKLEADHNCTPVFLTQEVGR